MKLIASELNEFLRRFKRPDHLDNDQAMLEIKATCVAINKRMPSGIDKIAVLDRLGDAFQDVCEIFRGTGWPKTAVFVTSMENMARRKTNVVPIKNNSDDVFSPAAINAARMNAGQSVGDDWLYGRFCHELMETGDVTDDLLRKYRSALYFDAKAAVGEDKARQQEADWVKRHETAGQVFDGSKRFNAPTYHPKRFGGTA